MEHRSPKTGARRACKKTSLPSAARFFAAHTKEWRRDEQTRLQPDPATDLSTLTYDVSAAGEASCLFTVTHGSAHANYGSKSDIEIPGSGRLFTLFGVAFPFRVSYPTPGRYRVTVDWARHEFEIAPAAPPLAFFSSIPFFGDSQSYLPIHAERWSTPDDDGDSSGYEPAANGTLGEYSLIRGRSYADLLFSARVRSSEDLGANPAADFAIVYGFVDADNYSFMLFSSEAAQTRLVRVVDGLIRGA